MAKPEKKSTVSIDGIDAIDIGAINPSADRELEEQLRASIETQPNNVIDLAKARQRKDEIEQRANRDVAAVDTSAAKVKAEGATPAQARQLDETTQKARAAERRLLQQLDAAESRLSKAKTELDAKQRSILSLFGGTETHMKKNIAQVEFDEAQAELEALQKRWETEVSADSIAKKTRTAREQASQAQVAAEKKSRGFLGLYKKEGNWEVKNAQENASTAQQEYESARAELVADSVEAAIAERLAQLDARAKILEADESALLKKLNETVLGPITNKQIVRTALTVGAAAAVTTGFGAAALGMLGARRVFSGAMAGAGAYGAMAGLESRAIASELKSKTISENTSLRGWAMEKLRHVTPEDMQHFDDAQLQEYLAKAAELSTLRGIRPSADPLVSALHTEVARRTVERIRTEQSAENVASKIGDYLQESNAQSEKAIAAVAKGELKRKLAAVTGATLVASGAIGKIFHVAHDMLIGEAVAKELSPEPSPEDQARYLQFTREAADDPANTRIGKVSVAAASKLAEDGKVVTNEGIVTLETGEVKKFPGNGPVDIVLNERGKVEVVAAAETQSTIATPATETPAQVVVSTQQEQPAVLVNTDSPAQKSVWDNIQEEPKTTPTTAETPSVITGEELNDSQARVNTIASNTKEFGQSQPDGSYTMTLRNGGTMTLRGDVLTYSDQAGTTKQVTAENVAEIDAALRAESVVKTVTQESKEGIPAQPEVAASPVTPESSPKTRAEAIAAIREQAGEDPEGTGSNHIATTKESAHISETTTVEADSTNRYRQLIQGESGGDPGIISKGDINGDHGGKSYGLFQLSLDQGSAEKFTEWAAKQDAIGKMLADAGKPGTPEYDAMWKQLAEKHRQEFIDLQVRYQDEVYFPTFEKDLQEELGVGLQDLHPVSRQLAETVLNQYGNSFPWDKCFPNTTPEDIQNMDPREFINRVSDYRRDTIETHFRSTDSSWYKGLKNRVENDRQELLALLDSGNFDNRSVISKIQRVVPSEPKTLFTPEGGQAYQQIGELSSDIASLEGQYKQLDWKAQLAVAFDDPNATAAQREAALRAYVATEGSAIKFNAETGDILKPSTTKASVIKIYKFPDHTELTVNGKSVTLAQLPDLHMPEITQAAQQAVSDVSAGAETVVKAGEHVVSQVDVDTVKGAVSDVAAGAEIAAEKTKEFISGVDTHTIEQAASDVAAGAKTAAEKTGEAIRGAVDSALDDSDLTATEQARANIMEDAIELDDDKGDIEPEWGTDYGRFVDDVQSKVITLLSQAADIEYQAQHIENPVTEQRLLNDYQETMRLAKALVEAAEDGPNRISDTDRAALRAAGIRLPNETTASTILAQDIAQTEAQQAARRKTVENAAHAMLTPIRDADDIINGALGNQDSINGTREAIRNIELTRADELRQQYDATGDERFLARAELHEAKANHIQQQIDERIQARGESMDQNIAEHSFVARSDGSLRYTQQYDEVKQLTDTEKEKAIDRYLTDNYKRYLTRYITGDTPRNIQPFDNPSVVTPAERVIEEAEDGVARIAVAEKRLISIEQAIALTTNPTEKAQLQAQQKAVEEFIQGQYEYLTKRFGTGIWDDSLYAGKVTGTPQWGANLGRYHNEPFYDQNGEVRPKNER